MRILIDARPFTDPRKGGVARVASELSAALVAASPDDEFIFATTGSATPRLSDRFVRPNVRHVHLKIPNKLWSAACVLGIVDLPRSVERRVGTIDACFFPNLGFIGRLATRNSTLLLHDLSFLIEPRWFTRKQRLWPRAVNAKRLIADATHLLAVSETTKRDAMRLLGIPEDRITVIPIGPTLSAAPLEPRPAPDRTILCLGAKDPRKNARTAIAAVETLKREPGYEDLRLVIVGRDVQDPSDAELASLYANAAAFLYPSWYEGYGLPLHEAAQFGTPCIASTAGALPETAPPGTLFADPAKPHHWVEALRSTIDRSRILVQTDPNGWEKAAAIFRKILISSQTRPGAQTPELDH